MAEKAPTIAVESAPATAPAPAAAASSPAPEAAPAQATAQPESAAPTTEAAPTESVLSAASETLKPAETTEAPKPEAKEGEATEAKPAEAKAEEAPKPEEAKPAEPPPPIEYKDLKFPEGVKFEDADVKAYTDVFGKHQVPQAAVEELIALHANKLQEQSQRQATLQRETWENTRKGWVDTFVNDPDMGGKVRETTLSRAAGVIERYGGTAAQQQELRDVLSLTGAGDHPALIRVLANVGKALGEGRIVPAVRTKPAPSKSSPRSRYNSGN